ncbi:hypothetical protein SLV14_005676 [Streptomyces sp. Je 1-4]|uniref:hypothetical protein n=1 Tax=Streptomyces TaxID=1883 RepID=UPI0021D9E418|nr:MULTISPECIES: hypothetical protein [unclassified Streptomyces]UYB42769.1 hypothetical protein SLV14_005676 [Streptomyces sp. Je 1-4]UZQ39099.1 hypothetical protein SLV14N_005676 [Streptomyces sp. Je 1-4] [Streptomyces sp. Je 1-4 4N24]UZQ46516.1 hypothetical protein SLV14NA_005676 [Streptomyces sp. Je 1-4] [Streptomyces sp. Je 1-4 4N24_ara]
MREQGKAVARCGRLLLFTALIAGIVAMHTFGTVCRAVLSLWALALLALLGTGLLTGYRETGLLTALRARLPRGLWPISAPPRHTLLDRLSVLRV